MPTCDRTTLVALATFATATLYQACAADVSSDSDELAADPQQERIAATVHDEQVVKVWSGVIDGSVARPLAERSLIAIATGLVRANASQPSNLIQDALDAYRDLLDVEYALVCSCLLEEPDAIPLITAEVEPCPTKPPRPFPWDSTSRLLQLQERAAVAELARTYGLSWAEVADVSARLAGDALPLNTLLRFSEFQPEALSDGKPKGDNP